jgi:radical SAM protein with 4Fe4S-binding SPASM domain
MAKGYAHQGADPDNPDKSSARSDDGHVASHTYSNRSRFLRRQAGASADGQRAVGRQYVDLDYHHPLEDLLDRRWMQKLLGYVSKSRPSGKTMIEEILESYANPTAPLSQRIKYWLFHLFIKRIKGSVTDPTFRDKIGQHISTVRGLVVTARSVAEYGLTLPQRFSAPLIVVWNLTNQCNLRCRHCYQDSERERLGDELGLAEKLDLVDQIGEMYVPMIAFAGGEPTVNKDLLPVLRRCQKHGIHTTLATHGGTMTPRLAARLAKAGIKYVEISLDSVDPVKHDAFRGEPGMWRRTVEGMGNVVKQEGMRLGVAMCIHRGNFEEVEDMLQFAVDMGASCFAHFNFIPVGRGLEMAGSDLDPSQREQLLHLLNKWMQSGRIGVLSTSPQFGRICIAHTPVEGKQSCSHVGGGGGEKARVIAKYLGGCGAGRCYVAVEPNGDITPCVYLPHRLLGNIRCRRLADIFRNNEFWELLCDRDWRTHHCEVCEFKHYCGGCRARADAYFGELNAGDPGCLFNHKHWDALVAAGAAIEHVEGTESTDSGVRVEWCRGPA